MAELEARFTDDPEYFPNPDYERGYERGYATALAALPSAPDQRLRDALDEALPVKDTETHSETGIPITLAIHFGSRAGLIESIVEIVARSLSEATTSPKATLDVERLCNLVVQAFAEFATEGERARQAGWSFLSDAYAIARTHPTLAARLRGPA